MPFHPEDSCDALPLSVRARNVLKNCRVHTIREFLDLAGDPKRLIALPNLGAKTFHEIQALASRLQREPSETSLAFPLPPAVKDGVRAVICEENAPATGDGCHEADSTPVDQLHFSVRASNALKRAGCFTVGELMALSEDALSGIRNLGRSSLTEVLAWRARQTLTEPVSQTEPVPRTESVPRTGSAPRSLRLIWRDGRHMDGVMTEEEITRALQFAQKNMDGALRALRAGGFRETGRPAAVSPHLLLYESGFENCRLYAEAARLAARYSADTGTNESQAVWRAVCALLDAPLSNWRQAGEYALYASRAGRRYIKNAIFDHLAQQPFDCAPEAVVGIFPSELQESEFVGEVLSEMERLGELERVRDGYVLASPTLPEYLAGMTDAKLKGILTRRLRGDTLTEIGSGIGITRERVRQLLEKALSRLPRLKEDRYLPFFREYALEPSDGAMLFERADVFNYLDMRAPRGTRPLEEALDDQSLPVWLRRRIERAAYKNEIIEDGARIRRTRAALIQYVIQHDCLTATSIEQFFQYYQALLTRHALARDAAFALDMRSFHNKVALNRDILCRYKSCFRYYPTSAYDFTELLEALSLSQYHDVELSALKLYRSFPDLMKQYDIQDEYELHNLLKKLLGDVNGIVFSRMPNIEFGAANRDNQVFELLLELAPVGNVALAEAYEKTYGVKSRTVLANYFGGIGKYMDGGVYRVDLQPLPEAEQVRMRCLLDGDFYAIDRIKSMYQAAFPGRPTSNINALTLRQLGFQACSGCAVRCLWSSSTEYFRHLLSGGDLIRLDGLPTDVVQANSFYAVLCEFRRQYDLVEVLPGQYVNLRRLARSGAGIPELEAYCAAVYAASPENAIFTVKSLRADGFTHPLERVALGDWFLSSVLAQRGDLFTVSRIGKTRAFARGRQMISRAAVICQLVKGQGTISVNDLISLMDERYGIKMDRETVLNQVAGSALYYSRVSDQAYADSERYFAQN